MEKYITIRDSAFKFRDIRININDFDELVFMMEKGYHCEGLRWKKVKENKDLVLLMEMLEDNDTPYTIEFI